MLDTSKVTAALVAQLEAAPSIIQSQAIVTRNQFLNMDPSITPWIGIYKNSVDYDPATLGKHGTSFKSALDLKIVVQVSGFKETVVEDTLEDLVKKTMDVVWDDPTIDGNVLMVTGFNIQYSFRDTETVDQYFQWAIISLKLEARSG